MKSILKLEEAALLVLSVALFSTTDYAWWVFPALLLVPDVSMAGYLLNPGVGAACYNIVHHRGTAIAVILLGYYTGNAPVLLAGIILFGHIAMDRLFGYGLKYPDSFHHTHLGEIGKKD